MESKDVHMLTSGASATGPDNTNAHTTATATAPTVAAANAHDTTLARNAPLAPTQELAYRKKCIQLKRRLAEIEASNDSTRRRIVQETEHVQRMRLLRAILLNHLNDIMTAPAKKLSAEQLDKIGVLATATDHLAQQVGNGVAPDLRPSRPEGEALLDDSSEASDDEEPEPVERPERRRKPHTTYRETIMNPSTPAGGDQSAFQTSTLTHTAPLKHQSPATAHDPGALTSSYRVSSSSVGPGAAHSITKVQPPADPRFDAASPMRTDQAVQDPVSVRGPAAASSHADPDDVVHAPLVLMRPERPDPPYVQFTAHMTPQLEADDYPPHLIPDRIQTEWEGMSAHNRKLWEDRYQEMMLEYEEDMDAYKKATRREAAGSRFGP